MNTKTIELSVGQLKKTGKPYRICLLGKNHIPQILELQDKVNDALPENQKSFILPKSRSFFEAMFDRGHTMIGIFSEGKLIAQSIMLNPSAAHPDTGMVDMQPIGPPESVTVLEGVLVDPAYRGNQLMQYMVKTWLDLADLMGKIHALAEIAVDNPFSWSVFIEKGLKLVSFGTDPDDGTLLYNACETVKNARAKNLSGVFNFYAKKPKVICAANDHHLQKKLMDSGYHAVKHDRKKGGLLMVKAA